MIHHDILIFLVGLYAGDLCRTINDDLRAWITQHLRKGAARGMDDLRTKLPKVSTDEVARWIREDRDHGH